MGTERGIPGRLSLGDESPGSNGKVRRTATARCVIEKDTKGELGRMV